MEYLLVVAMLTGPDKADAIKRYTDIKTLDECTTQANDWLHRKVTDDLRKIGVIGFSAMCAWREKPSKDD